MPSAGDLAKSLFKVERCTVQEKDNSSSKIECHFNPTQVSITKQANYADAPASGAASSGGTPSQYTGPGKRTVTMTLLFDNWENLPGGVAVAAGPIDVIGSSGISVADAMTKLFGWLDATRQSFDQHSPRPPVLEVHWGSQDVFTGVLKTVTGTYTMFARSGAPLRGTAEVHLEEVPQPPGHTNPTSGGRRGRSQHTVSSGDSLHSIAYAQYRDVRLWRAIAAANGIDDPLRVAPGTTLLIPSLLEAARGEG